MGEESGDTSTQGSIFAVFFFALLLGVVCRTLLGRSRVPYTVLLLTFGLIVGATVVNDTDRPGIDAWIHINPHVVLFAFLPILIFESAFSADCHIFLRELSQVLALAVPGVIVATTLTGIFIMTAFPYGWGWDVSLMVGAMLSATDPVAVVALMKELGVSKRLATLMEGESLLNDGTSIVIFTVFKDAATGTSRSVGQVVLFFFRLALGGPVLGMIVGYLAVTCLGYIYNDAMSEITITLVAAFGAFIMAEALPIRTSGVLAVVVVGLYMSYVGRTRVSPTVEHSLHSFWQVLGYVANTLIFFLSGMIVMDKGIIKSEVTAADWGRLFLLYIMLLVIRFITVMLCYPVLKRWGYGITWQQAATLIWGGLRGAVGLTLALIVEEDEKFGEDKKNRVLFFMSGIAALTLFINGTSMEYVLIKLGLNRNSAASEDVFSRACSDLDRVASSAVARLKEDQFLRDADWRFVWQYIPVHTKEVYKTRMRKVGKPGVMVAPRVRARWRRYVERYGEPEDNLHEDLSREIRKTAWRTGAARVVQAAVRWKNAMLKSSETEELLEHDGNGRANSKTSSEGGRSERELSDMENPIHDSTGAPALDASGVDVEGAEQDSPTGHINIIEEARRRLLSSTKAQYWILFERGCLGPAALRVLLEASNRQLDSPDEPLHLAWKYLDSLVSVRVEELAMLPCIQSSTRFPLVGAIIHTTLHHRMSFGFDVATNYIRSQEEVKADLLGQQVAEIIHPQVRARLAHEIDSGILAANRWLANQVASFPEIARSIKTKVATRMVLAEERRQIHHLLTVGHLDEAEHDKMLLDNNVSLIKLQYHPPTLGYPGKSDMLREVDFLQDVGEEAFCAVVNLAKERFLSPNEELFKEGSKSTAFYVVARGSCRATRTMSRSTLAQIGDAPSPAQAASRRQSATSQRHIRDDGHGESMDRLPEGDDQQIVAIYHTGMSIGLVSAMLEIPHRSSTHANCLTQAFEIEIQPMLRLAGRHHDLATALWSTLALRLAPDLSQEFAHIPPVTMRRVLHDAELFVLHTGGASCALGDGEGDDSKEGTSPAPRSIRSSVASSVARRITAATRSSTAEARQRSGDSDQTAVQEEEVLHNSPVLGGGVFLLHGEAEMPDARRLPAPQFLRLSGPPESLPRFTNSSVLLVLSAAGEGIFHHMSHHTSVLAALSTPNQPHRRSASMGGDDAVSRQSRMSVSALVGHGVGVNEAPITLLRRGAAQMSMDEDEDPRAFRGAQYP